MAEQFIQGFKTAEGSKLYDYNALGNKPTDIKLDRVENKSSADIREEITRANVINALGYNPIGEEGIEEMVKEAVDQAMSEDDADVALATANQAIERLDKLEPQVKVGNSLTLANSAIAPLRNLKLFGKTTQFTSSGRQLLDISKVAGASGNDFVTEIIEDQFRVWTNGNYTNTQAAFIFEDGLILDPGTYTLSVNKELPFSFRLGYSQDVWLIKGEKSVSFEITTPTDLKNISIVFNPSDGAYEVKFKVMLNSGSEVLPWESFSDGKVSPSPEHPEKLNSAGSNGEINVSLFGENLAMYDQIDGEPSEIDENGFIVVTNNSGDTKYINVPIADPYGDFVITIEAQNAFVYIQKYADDYSTEINATKSTIVGANGYLRIRWGTANGSTSKVKIMAAKGTLAKAFAPYSRQVLKVETPNGLPGIPVDEGGNYTDENGQQWVCDEIDFARGVRIQRIGEIHISGTNSGLINNTKRFYVSNSVGMIGENNAISLCNVTSVYAWDQADYVHYYIEDNGVAVFVPADYDAVSKPIHIIGAIKKPIETPLSEEQLTAYAALHTNSPQTFVFDDSIADMELAFFPPSAMVPMFFSSADKGKVLSVDENGCVVLGGELDLDLDIDSVVYAEEDGEDVPGAVSINADTLGGRLPEEFVLDEELQDYATKAQLGEVEDKIPTTAEQIGARPNTWMPTAAEVGARPNTWLPTIAEIGAAPAGYGFGESAIQLSNSLLNNDAELETVLEAIYSTMKSAETKVIRFAGYPSNSDYVSFGFLFKSSANNGSFVAYSAFARGTSITKTKYGGAWQPLEWVNPPMELGKEYRTTELWNGKAVYTKCVDFGALPSSSAKSVNHGSTGKIFLGVRFVLNNNTPLTVGDGASKIGVSTTAVYLTTTTTFNNTATAQIWYTKD